MQPSGRSALPKVPERRWTYVGNSNGEQPHAPECLVLGSLSDCQSDAGYLRRTVSETTGLSRHETAFAILHRLRAGMVRADQDRIGGSAVEHIEVDESMVGGRARGKGCGVHHMALVVAAVDIRQRKPGTELNKRKGRRYAGRVRFVVVPNRSAKSLCGFVKSTVEPGTLVVADDWRGYTGLEKCSYKHFAATQLGDASVTEECLPIIHLVFANLKSWLLGTHHGVSHQHLQTYLNEFIFRFNRRFYPFNSFRSLLGIAGAAAAPTYDKPYSGKWQYPTSCGLG